jgi:hypothetical protein
MSAIIVPFPFVNRRSMILRQARYAAGLNPDGAERHRQPFLGAARVLITAGYPPAAWIEGWHPGAAQFALRARLGIAARLSVDETRTILVRWKPFSWSAVASSTRFAKASATNLAERAETSPSATAAEPDPPDKRRRPRTGNPRAREVLVRAAAKSRYFSIDLASSLPNTEARR